MTVVRVPGRLHDRDQVVANRVLRVHALRRILEHLHVGEAQPGRRRRLEHAGVDALQDLELVLGVGVVDDLLEQEAVELRLGQQVRALLLDRVLGRDHQERRRHLVDRAADRGLPLLHRLEHRALGLRARPVDLVEQHDVGVHRAELGRELALARVVDLRADDVARQQVGRALDAAELSLDGIRERAGGRRFRETRDALEQDVPVGDERRHDALAQLLLADDLAGERVRHLLDDGGRLLELGGGERSGRQVGRDSGDRAFGVGAGERRSGGRRGHGDVGHPFTLFGARHLYAIVDHAQTVRASASTGLPRRPSIASAAAPAAERAARRVAMRPAPSISDASASAPAITLRSSSDSAALENLRARARRHDGAGDEVMIGEAAHRHDEDRHAVRERPHRRAVAAVTDHEIDRRQQLLVRHEPRDLDVRRRRDPLGIESRTRSSRSRAPAARRPHPPAAEQVALTRGS